MSHSFSPGNFENGSSAQLRQPLPEELHHGGALLREFACNLRVQGACHIEGLTEGAASVTLFHLILLLLLDLSTAVELYVPRCWMRGDEAVHGPHEAAVLFEPVGVVAEQRIVYLVVHAH